MAHPWLPTTRWPRRSDHWVEWPRRLSVRRDSEEAEAQARLVEIPIDHAFYDPIRQAARGLRIEVKRKLLQQSRIFVRIDHRKTMASAEIEHGFAAKQSPRHAPQRRASLSWGA